MIERIYFKDNLSFSSCELEFSPGLNVITGASGAGKSVLFKGILSAFALADASAALLSCEASLALELEGLSSDESNIFGYKKERSLRYFYNHQSVSKKQLAEQMSEKISYLGAKGAPEMSPAALLCTIDAIALKMQGEEFSAILNEYSSVYKELASAQAQLEQLIASESNAAQMCEFLEFEIGKLKKAALKVGEYDELLAAKSKLAKADKLEAALNEASGIFDYVHKVQNVLKIAGINDEKFTDLMAELEDEFALISQTSSDMNIEQIMARLDVIAPMVKKYGSEEEAIAALAQKEQELATLSDVEFNRSALEKKINKLQTNCLQIAGRLSERRSLATRALEGKIGDYLSLLYLSNLSLKISKTDLKASGADEVQITLNGAGFKDISSGELNRLRLGFCAASAALAGRSGVMFMDEIDANLSGKEAISIAKVITELAQHFQVFVITHLPWLCARADCHILVERSGQNSSARVLAASEIQAELARMISDEETNQSAMEFAKALLEKKEN